MTTYKFYGTQQVASTYGSSSFGTCNYNGTACDASNASGGSSNGSLVNTGVAIAGIVTLACLVLLVAVVVRVWRRPAKTATQEAAANSGRTPGTRPQ